MYQCINACALQCVPPPAKMVVSALVQIPAPAPPWQGYGRGRNAKVSPMCCKLVTLHLDMRETLRETYAHDRIGRFVVVSLATPMEQPGGQSHCCYLLHLRSLHHERRTIKEVGLLQ
jgi:hypothetical protein